MVSVPKGLTIVKQEEGPGADFQGEGGALIRAWLSGENSTT